MVNERKKLDYPSVKNFASPKQLQNSLDALEGHHTQGDQRIVNYKAQIPEALIKEVEWQAREKRIKSIRKNSR